MENNIKMGMVMGSVVVLLCFVGLLIYSTPDKITPAIIYKNLEEMNVQVKTMQVVYKKIDRNKYVTTDGMTLRAHKVVRGLNHTETCNIGCKESHEDGYKVIKDFNRLDKQLEIEGAIYGCPYQFNLTNKKDKAYHLYYDMVIDLPMNQEILNKLGQVTNDIAQRWGVETQQTIEIVGLINKVLTDEEAEGYRKEIIKSLKKHTKKENIDIQFKRSDLSQGTHLVIYVTPKI